MLMRQRCRVATRASHGAQTANAKLKLVGYKNFVRHNPRTDKFPIHRFHHAEFWCADATTTFKRFQHSVGMTLVAKSDQSTGNSHYASYVLQSGELVFAFTAPYSPSVASNSSTVPLPHYSHEQAFQFNIKHGLGVRAIGLTVDDATQAYEVAVANGAVGVLPPTRLLSPPSQPSQSSYSSAPQQQQQSHQQQQQDQVISEVKVYGDVVLRFVSGAFKGPFLAPYTPVTDSPRISYGIKRVDHAVGNVPKLVEALEYIMGFTGFHEFAEFVAEDVGTLDSGLNSMVLANNNEFVLLPMNEPTFGTPRKSQIQTYLEQNEGAGLQHLALLTDDIFATLREMQSRSAYGGFEFMPRPSDAYYRSLPDKVGPALTPAQYAECERLGVLVDRDDQGVLLQIFTKPLGDRPTVFLEIIQRIGCMPQQATAGGATNDSAAISSVTPTSTPSSSSSGVGSAPAAAVGVPPVAAPEQAAGCGGFGKGNFSELFKRIEDYERTLNV